MSEPKTPDGSTENGGAKIAPGKDDCNTRFLKVLMENIPPDTSLEAYAGMLGVSVRTMYNWVRGTKSPSLMYMRKALRALGKDPESELPAILGNDGPNAKRPRGAGVMSEVRQSLLADPPAAGTFGTAAVSPTGDTGRDWPQGIVFSKDDLPVSIPIIDPSLPPEARRDTRGLAPMVFRHGWLYALGNPGSLRAFVARGGALEPMVQDGDLVLVDVGQTKPADGKLYLLRQDGEPMVRRIFTRIHNLAAYRPLGPDAENLTGGNASESDNPLAGRVILAPAAPNLHPTTDAPLESLDIIGRLAWVGRDLTRA